MTFKYRDEFALKKTGAGHKFKFNDLRRHQEPPEELVLQGYVEVRDFDSEPESELDLAQASRGCGAAPGDGGGPDRPWMRRYFELKDYQLHLYDIQPIERDLSIRVLVKTIEITTNLHLKEFIRNRTGSSR